MKRDRLRQILDDLQIRGKLSTEEACIAYHASEATIRRNFNELASSGLAVRVHGGVRLLDEQFAPSVPYSLRETWNANEKKLLAREAAGLIQRHHSVMLYGGSTTEQIGYFLNGGRIITNSPDVCRILRVRFPSGNGPEVIQTGGRLNYRTGLLEGAAMRRSIEHYECDLGMASVFGVDEEGIWDINDECSELIAMMLMKSRTRIVLADHTKFGRKSFCRCLPWEKLHILITTFHPEYQEIYKAVRAQGVRIQFTKSPVPPADDRNSDRPSERQAACVR